MGKPKPPEEWTTDQALRKLFPKPVADELKRVARGASPRKKRAVEKPSFPGDSEDSSSPSPPHPGV
jgi:hypothetical protein